MSRRLGEEVSRRLGHVSVGYTANVDDKRGTRLANFEPQRATRRGRLDVYPDRIAIELLDSYDAKIVMR